MGGLLTGNLPVIKSFVQEITDDTNRGQGFGILTMSWSVGSVLAALTGGALSHPVDQYPSLFAGHGYIIIILRAYPYLLPCLFAVLFNVLTALWCAAFMTETLHRGSQESGDVPQRQYYQQVMVCDTDSTAGDISTVDSGHIEISTVVAGPFSRGYGAAKEAAVSSGDSSDGDSILSNGTVVLVAMNYATLCAASIILAETLPLFLKATVSEGGYSLSSLRIGQVLAAAAIGSVVLSSLLLPFISGWSNGLMVQASTLLSALMVLGLPLISSINSSAYVSTVVGSAVLHWSLLLVPLVLELQFEILAFTAILMQVNASAPKEQLARVNALAQSLGSLSRAAAPALGGFLWSVGFSYQFIYVNFIVCALLYVCCCLVNRALPGHLTRLLS